MSDRSSAALFAMIFELLAENPTDEHKKMAKEVFEKSRDYDFSAYQMYADDALIALGLARKGVDPEYPDGGEVMLAPAAICTSCRGQLIGATMTSVTATKPRGRPPGSLDSKPRTRRTKLQLAETPEERFAVLRKHYAQKPVERYGTLIYFICDAYGNIKIGKANRHALRSRVAAIQTANAHPVKLLLAVDANHHGITEMGLHAMFSELRLFGEWFSPSPELIAYIQSLGQELPSATIALDSAK